jgi:hypothetical protein
MSYSQAMQWNRKHPKGTRQPMHFSTGSGFWPSAGFLEDYNEYTAQCAISGTKAIPCEAYYRSLCAAVAPELNQPIIETVADRIIEELKND